MLLLFMADGNQKRQQGQHRAYACYSYQPQVCQQLPARKVPNEPPVK